MKKNEQIRYILTRLFQEGPAAVGNLQDYCINRGIAGSSEEFLSILDQMAKKKYITAEEGRVKPIITEQEAKKFGVEDFLRTFANGGSQDKMIYSPSSTSVTFK